MITTKRVKCFIAQSGGSNSKKDRNAVFFLYYTKKICRSRHIFVVYDIAVESGLQVWLLYNQVCKILHTKRVKKMRGISNEKKKDSTLLVPYSGVVRLHNADCRGCKADRRE